MNWVYGKKLYKEPVLLVDLWQSKPVDPYLIAQLGKIFNGFYAAQKAHQLAKLIDLPSPFYSSSYNLLLQFVQNLYLEDFSSISYQFLRKYYPRLDYYLPFTTAYNTSKQIAEQ